MRLTIDVRTTASDQKDARSSRIFVRRDAFAQIGQ
jgi:hypothetical protein